MFPQIVSKCYIFCINLFFNIFISCQINIIIWVDRLGHVKCVKFNINFLTMQISSVCSSFVLWIQKIFYKILILRKIDVRFWIRYTPTCCAMLHATLSLEIAEGNISRYGNNRVSSSNERELWYTVRNVTYA